MYIIVNLVFTVQQISLLFFIDTNTHTPKGVARRMSGGI